MSDNVDKSKRKRKRRGGLRVPSDKVPRTKSPSTPTPEDPRLAMSVALAFGSGEGNETSSKELVGVEETDPDASFGDHNTIELDAVADIEDIDDLDTAIRLNAAAANAANANAANNAANNAAAADNERTEATVQHPIDGLGGIDSDVHGLVDDDEERTIVSLRPASEGGSLDIAFDDAPSEPATERTRPIPVIAEPEVAETNSRYVRARTVALSDADLEELIENDSSERLIPHDEDVLSSSSVDGEPQRVNEVVSAKVLIEPRRKRGSEIPESIMAAESGEIIADDMLEELDEGRAIDGLSGSVELVGSSDNPSSDPSLEILTDQEISSDSQPTASGLIISEPVHQAAPKQAEPKRKRAENSEPPPPPPPVSRVKFTKPVSSPNTSDGQEGGPAGKPPPLNGKAKPVSQKTGKPASSESGTRRRVKGKPWFEEVFDENYLRTLPFLTPQATESEANFVLDSLNLEPGAQILDVGCGYGRHSMELAARGYHLVGLDMSLPLLLRGADEAQRRGLNINFVHGDMREMQFESQFDGAFCLFETFGYFDDETNIQTAKNIARALKPGARLVLDVLNRDYLVRELPTRVWWEGDGCVVLEEVDFNYFSSRITSKRSIAFEDGRQLEQEISIRAFALHELGKVLHGAGFRVVEVSGSMFTRGRFFGTQSRDIIIIAEKRS